MHDRIEQNHFLPEIREFQKKSGERVWVELTASIIKDASGHLKQIITNYIDITERRKAEEKNLQLASLVMSSNDAIFGTTVDGIFTSWNKGAEITFGYAESEVIGKSISLLMPPDRNRTSWAKEKMLRGEFVNNLEVIRVRKDGRQIHTILTLSPVYDVENRVVGIASISRDVTELKQAEKALRESEKFNSGLLANSPNPIVVLKPDTSVYYVNKAFEELTGFKRAEVLNLKPPFPWWKPEHHDIYKAQSKEAMEKGCCRQERLIRKKDGEDVWIEYDHATIIEDGEVQYYLSMWVDKTERKEAEQRLILSEKKYSTLVEKGNDGVIIIQDGLLKFVNSKLVEMTGFSSEESLRKPFIDFVSPAYLSLVAATYKKRLAGEATPDKYEIEILAKDGRSIPVEISASIIEYEGKPADMAIIRDITERKRIESNLKRSEENFRRSLDDSPLGIRIMSKKGETIYANQAILDMFGYVSIKELRSIPIKERYTPESYVEYQLREEKRQCGGSLPYSYEVGIIRKNREIRHVQLFCKEVVWNGENQFQVLYQDITERRKMEDHIKHAAEEWRITFDSIPDLVSIIDRNFKLVRVNQAFANVLGLKPKDLIGSFCYETQLGRNDPCQNCYLQDVVRTKVPRITEISEPDQRIFEVGVSPMFDKNGEVEFCIRVARDITQQKKMREQLMLSDRLASIGELAAGIAHELNNPLTSVVGFSQLILEGEISPEIKDDLTVVNNEAQRASKIVKNLLTFARKHSPVKQSGQINDCITEVLTLRAYEHKCQNIKVISRLDAELPRAMFDYFQMQQVLINLIINAEFFMVKAHNGGNLTITTEKADGIIRACVSDDGPGITQEDLKHLFSPFFTTKEVGKGTGLGLSICHGIISEHGGKIFARSETGKGATFIIELPVPDSK
jgi:PAS domain S-box-containing protein